MQGARLGVLGGLFFGVVLVWHGIGAAGLVLLFALVGALVGVGLWIWWGILNGTMDVEAIKKLVGEISSKSDSE